MGINMGLEKYKPVWIGGIVGLLTILICNFVSAVEELIPVIKEEKSLKQVVYQYISQYSINVLILVVLITLSLIILKIIKKRIKYKSIWIGTIIGFILGLIGYYAMLMFYARCWQECEVRWVGNILDFLTPIGALVIFVLIITIIGGMIGYLIIRSKK